MAYIISSLGPVCVEDTCDCKTNESFKFQENTKFDTKEGLNICNTWSAVSSIGNDSQSCVKTDTEQKHCTFEAYPTDTTQTGPSKTHIGQLQIRNKRYTCKVCTAAFITLCKMREHMRIHTGEKPYKCKICLAAFAQSTGLKYHIMTVHEVEKPHSCEICDATFPFAISLKRHMRVHTREKRQIRIRRSFEAYQTDTTQTGPSNTHRGQLQIRHKRYTCKVCLAAFLQLGHLKEHMRVHTGEKPYKCKLCLAAFSVSGNLRKHRRIHTGEKPYSCEICLASFSTASSLKAHMKVHTIEQPHKQ